MRPRLTFANVVSVLALFVALGGASYAALKLPRSSVGTKQLKKNAVIGVKVKDHSLTGKDLNLTKLDTVPSAAGAGHADTAGDATTLQGSGPDAFVHGAGSVVSGRLDMDARTTATPLIEVPGVAAVTAECDLGPKASFDFKNTSGAVMDISESINGGSAMGDKLAAGGTVGSTSSEPLKFEFDVATRTEPPSVASFDILMNTNAPRACLAFAQATAGR